MDDAGRHFDIYGDPDVSVYAPSGPLADIDASRRMLQAMKDHWWKHGFGNWAISTAETPGHVIGFGGLAYRQINGRERLTFRFRFAWDTWGMGYGHELGLACFGVAFRELRADAVHALVLRGDRLARRFRRCLLCGRCHDSFHARTPFVPDLEHRAHSWVPLLPLCRW